VETFILQSVLTLITNLQKRVYFVYDIQLCIYSPVKLSIPKCVCVIEAINVDKNTYILKSVFYVTLTPYYTGLLEKKYTLSKIYFTKTTDAKSVSCVGMERKYLKVMI
jgi:hypothetical protein